MKNKIIKLLGGYTKQEYVELEDYFYEVVHHFIKSKNLKVKSHSKENKIKIKKITKSTKKVGQEIKKK